MEDYNEKVKAMNAYEVQRDIYRICNMLNVFLRTKNPQEDGMVWNMLKALVERSRELGYEIKM